jgi:hypothetical protein
VIFPKTISELFPDVRQPTRIGKGCSLQPKPLAEPAAKNLHHNLEKLTRRLEALWAFLNPFHLLDFVDFGAARSFDLYCGAPGFADQRARDW